MRMYMHQSLKVNIIQSSRVPDQFRHPSGYKVEIICGVKFLRMGGCWVNVIWGMQRIQFSLGLKFMYFLFNKI